MTSRLAQSLIELFSGHARSTRVSDLKSQGIERVSLLGADQLAQLMERAIERALDRRVLELSEPEKAHLLERAHLEFEALRAQVQGLEGQAAEKRKELQDVESRLASLHSEFQRTNASLDAEILAVAQLEPAAPFDGSAELESLRRVIAGAGVADVSAVERAALAVAAFLQKERDRASESAAHQQRERIANLERRLAKLNETLARTEQELERAIQGTMTDEGIASIYRTVQGLRETAKDFERKRSMLADIYQKNFTLQKGAESPRGTRT